MKQAAPLPLSAAGFQHITACSDEVLARLGAYLALLTRWQERLNLVGPATLADPWRRHILDSAQLAPLIPAEAQVLWDAGSGAGLPGLVVAIMSGREVELIESDQRKCAFLREAARAAQAPVRVVARRIETLPPAAADVIFARALAPLPRLLALTGSKLTANGMAVFLKGKGWEDELTLAKRDWNISLEAVPSCTDALGMVLKISEIHRRHGS